MPYLGDAKLKLDDVKQFD